MDAATTSATSAAIVALAHWQVRAGHLDDVLAHVVELRAASLAEPGCLGYEVFRPLDAHDALLLVERYRDDDALQAHRHSAHYRERVTERILPLLEARQVELLQARPG